MRFAFLFILPFLFQIPVFAENEVDQSWFTCIDSSQCVLTDGLCGEFEAVNILHLDSYKTNVEGHKGSTHCYRAGHKFRGTDAICKDGICRAKAPKSPLFSK